MVFTRQEKEKLIEDLYDRGKTYPQIAREVRVSVRDIRPVLEKAERERERKLGLTNQVREKNNSNNPQPQGPSVASQAYLLFSEGKTLLEVAVQLHIREKEATKYYREHWKLKGLYRFNQIYEDYKDDIPHILKLNRKMKAAGIGIEQAINLIKIANDGLPAVEQKYQKLRSEVNLMESRKFKEYRSLRNLQVQIADSKRILKC
jgi:predicted transcriptional regulator